MGSEEFSLLPNFFENYYKEEKCVYHDQFSFHSLHPPNPYILIYIMNFYLIFYSLIISYNIF